MRRTYDDMVRGVCPVCRVYVTNVSRHQGRKRCSAQHNKLR